VKPRAEPEKQRVDRGGCWYTDGPSWLRGADRGGYAPSWRFAFIGFRCVLDVPKEKPSGCQG